MGALDDLAAALRARTKTRVYGTPYADETLAKLQQGLTAGDLANQQAQFNLSQSQELAPVREEILRSQIPEREAKLGKLQADTNLANTKSDPELLAAMVAKAKAKTALDSAQAEGAEPLRGARLKLMEAQTQRALRQPSAKSSKPVTSVGMDAEGNQVVIDRTDPTHPTSALISGPTSGTLGVKPTAQTQNRRDQADVIDSSADELLKRLSDPKIKASIGPVAGNIGLIKEKMGILPPEVRQLRTDLKSFASLLPILHGFRGGTALAHQFEQMVGDLNQGPEQLAAAIKQIQSLARQVKSGGQAQSDPLSTALDQIVGPKK